ncbi:MAG: ABC transporter ATP-binding protein/permease [Ruminococcus sp.]|nr:ABC transporter ATP-binding protein/permease [Ruminococcus sp.]
MLQIKKIKKQYVTGSLKQTALDDVSLNLRDNEFVAILGPSGSGKTTLLNVIGGLDRYDSGDLVINGISTKKYKDRDWDSYRNHTIGFVFQSYNLIEHQSILSNVELALTISGVKRSERRKKARQALEKVGLGDHVHKRPNQLSGGQMQRVAIARALVNDPDILLADEPTGALDTETSLQVMELLKEVAEDRLVVMVTHNPELAEKYATRIVNICDGKIVGDTNPCDVDEKETEPPKHKNMGKASMSLFTALSLSFNNLLTKKARTILTSFAGSIGIIGIALILSLSTGVNIYIEDVQKSTMSSYPITIEANTMDVSSLMKTMNENISEVEHKMDAVYPDSSAMELESSLNTSLKVNNLTAFKEYIDNPNNEIHEYIGENGIVYSYSPKFEVFAYDPDGKLVNTNGSGLPKTNGEKMMEASLQSMYEGMGVSMNQTCFSELIPDRNGKNLGNIVYDNATLVKGEWPDEYNEVVIVLDSNNEVPVKILYQLGIFPVEEYSGIVDKINKGEKIDTEKFTPVSYEDMLQKTFYLVPQCDFYVQNEHGVFADVSEDVMAVENLVASAVEIKVSGIIKPSEDADILVSDSNVAYTRSLTEYLMDYTKDSAVVKAQEETPEINVLNQMKFASTNEEKINDTKLFLAKMGISDKAQMFKSMSALMAQSESQQSTYDISASSQTMPTMPSGMEQMPTGMPTEMQEMPTDEVTLAQMFDEYIATAEDDVILGLYDNYISMRIGTYESNLTSFGVISKDSPSMISLYCDSFEAKDGIADCIEDYNNSVNEIDKITYTDYIGLLLSSVTTIINVISYVLIAFVSVSLVVSSIMIGIITYISVLERTKEIGILRAMGASKRNISQVFLSESFIVGLCAGLIGVGLTLLMLIPINAIIHTVAGTAVVSAALPIKGAIILVLLSVILTTIAGLFPSKKAARKDPVTALRTE